MPEFLVGVSAVVSSMRVSGALARIFEGEREPFSELNAAWFGSDMLLRCTRVSLTDNGMDFYRLDAQILLPSCLHSQDRMLRASIDRM